MIEERLDLIKDVFNKAEYIKTIDTSFNEFGAVSITEDQQLQPSVEEFFGLYNSLFYDIPSLGETNSHQYLIRTSGEYVNFDEVNDEIQALQAEIAQLRSDLLTAQMEAAQALISTTGDESAIETFNELNKELAAANENVITTNTTLSENTNASQNTPSTNSNEGTSPGGGSASTRY
jgi:hypothetical protein|tara:strand:- start:1506 stop:2036 length:531 start_codon:yes stop_codon:yes gene_type:complete